MRVLVTGADGFVGEHVVAALLARGHDVVGAITADSPDLHTLPPDDAARVEWRTFDLRDGPAVHTLVTGARPDALIHLAGIASVSRSWREPEETFRINATGSLHLLLALRSLPEPSVPRPVLLVGSAEAYGAPGSAERPLAEDAPLRPLNPYGASKAAQEMIGFAVGRGPHVRLIQTRSFQQIGPGQRPAFVTVDWASQLLDIRDRDRPAVLRVGNLDVSRDFLDVRDAAAAYIALLETPGAEGVYNVCSGRELSLRRLLELLQEATGVTVDLAVDADRLRPAEVDSLVGDPGRILRDTPWRPRSSPEAAIRDLVDFLAARPLPPS